jgi:FKBP-type peptidyl-prolyl cis-trans isomerase 2
MNLEKGDLVLIEYTGKLASNDQVFETTDQEKAKEAGIFSTSENYGPRLVIYGNGSMISGFEEALKSCEIGKMSSFRLSPQKAFGEKNPQLIKIVPEKHFLKNNIKPYPGLVVSLDGFIAKVKSVNSGRVVVDFNHPLAGEEVIYDIKVLKVIKDDKEKVEAILENLAIAASVSSNDGKIFVKFNQPEDEKTKIAEKEISALVKNVVFEKV